MVIIPQVLHFSRSRGKQFHIVSNYICQVVRYVSQVINAAMLWRFYLRHRFRSLQKQSTAPKVGFALSRTTTKGVSMIENQETLSSSLDVPTPWLRLRHPTEMKCVAFSVTIYRRRRSSRFKFIAMCRGYA